MDLGKVWIVLVSLYAVAFSAITANASPEYEVVGTVLQEDDSFVAVVRQHGVLYLLYDETIIGAVFDNPWLRDQAAFPAFAIMQSSVYLSDRPERKQAIQIGLGIGTVPTFLRDRGIRTDVVEISEAVATQASERFRYHRCQDAPHCDLGETFVMDGLDFIFQRAQEKHELPTHKYNLFIVDVYTGFNPVLFFVQEVMEAIKSNWLTSTDGVLVMNFVGYHHGPRSVVPRSIYKTLEAVFSHVTAYREVEDPTDEDACNIVFFASDAPIDFRLPTHGYYQNPDPNTYFYVVTNFPKWQVFTEDDEEMDGVRVLTQADHGEQEFAAIHVETQTHMRERVLERFPESLWQTLATHVQKEEPATTQQLHEKEEL